MDDQTFVEFITRRSANLVAMNPASLSKKSIIRQRKNLNSIQEKVEKMLRAIKEYIPDASADQPPKRFSANNKTEKIQELRLMRIELKRQEDYLTVAKDHGYETADKVEETEGSGSLDEVRQKILSNILLEQKKASAASPDKGGRGGGSGRFRPSPYGQYQPYGQFPPKQSYYPNQQQPGQGYMAAPMMSGGMPMYNSGMVMPGYSSAMGGMVMPGHSSAMGMMAPNRPQFNPGKGRGSPRFDKSNTTCNACNGVGHWRGDPECPLMQLALPGAQPGGHH